MRSVRSMYRHLIFFYNVFIPLEDGVLRAQLNALPAPVPVPAPAFGLAPVADHAPLDGVTLAAPPHERKEAVSHHSAGP